MIISGYQNLVKSIHLISKERENSKHKSIYSEKFLKCL